MHIYAITTATAIDEVGAADGMAGLDEAACVGFFATMEDAVSAVLSNAGDIHETNRDIAIIERVDEGLYLASPHERAFFLWGTDQKYHECDWPEALSRTYGFAIG